VPNGLSDRDYLAQQIIGRLSSRVLNRLFDNYERMNTYQWRTMFWALSGWWRAELTGQRTPWHQQAESLFRRQLQRNYPLRLNEIESGYPSWRTNQETMMVEYMVAESVVSYSMKRAGREHLRDLVLGFGDHGSWVGLVPSLYDQSLAEFETGWNRYLADRYGVEMLRP
jgi:hypothetical protein